MRKNNYVARAARTLVQFFDVSTKLQSQISKSKVLAQREHKAVNLGASTSPFAAYSVNNKECNSISLLVVLNLLAITNDHEEQA